MVSAIPRKQLLDQLLSSHFRLVRLKPNSKIPAGGAGWQDRITTSSDDAFGWPADVNIGVMGGSPLEADRRLLIVDVDVKNGQPGLESWKRLQADYRLPRTSEVITPSGGRHLYYAVPPDTPLSGIAHACKQRGYPGIDLIGDRSFVVAPPSSIGTGAYEWYVFPKEGIFAASSSFLDLLRHSRGNRQLECKGTQEKAIPGHLGADSTPSEYDAVGLLDRHHSQEDLQRAVQDIVLRYQLPGPGWRNDRMHRAVASLFGRGFGPSEVQAVMIAWHEHYRGVFDTPLEDALKLLDACIKSIVRSIQNGKFAVSGRQHLKSLADLKLTDRQELFLDDLLIPKKDLRPGKDSSCGLMPSLINKEWHGHDNNPQTPRVLRHFTKSEKQFAECLIHQAEYELARCPGEVFCMTNGQLCDLLQARFGTELDTKAFLPPQESVRFS